MVESRDDIDSGLKETDLSAWLWEAQVFVGIDKRLHGPEIGSTQETQSRILENIGEEF